MFISFVSALCRLLLDWSSGYCHGVDVLHKVVAYLLSATDLLSRTFNSYELKKIRITEVFMSIAEVSFLNL